MTFEQEIEHAINRTCQESASNTPDFILARYLNACLAAWNEGVAAREQWYGRPDPAKCGPMSSGPISVDLNGPDEAKVEEDT